jgi:hypothetical protein
MLLPTAMVMADNATKRHVLSARPTAPTVTGGSRRRPRDGAVRRVAAVVLRRIADRVEPAPATTSQVSAV